jgi:hypothetical protein
MTVLKRGGVGWKYSMSENIKWLMFEFIVILQQMVDKFFFLMPYLPNNRRGSKLVNNIRNDS